MVITLPLNNELWWQEWNLMLFTSDMLSGVASPYLRIFDISPVCANRMLYKLTSFKSSQIECLRIAEMMYKDYGTGKLVRLPITCLKAYCYEVTLGVVST